jgi:Interferon-induced transmembrane protein
MTPPRGEQQPYGQPGEQPYGQPYPQQPGYPPAPGYGHDAPGYGYQAPPTPPDNHLVWAILSTILCCLPLGIVSIIKSTQVSSLWAQGQYDAARKSADDAKKWAIWAAVSGLAVELIVVIIYVIAIAAAVSTTS